MIFSNQRNPILPLDIHIPDSEANVVDDLVTEEQHYFHEGSSMRKIGDTYYYVYADMERGKPTSLGYSTGKSPLGPFTYQGIIIDNDGCDPQSWNNHGSIECVNGQWYVFYHRCSRGTQQHRRLCVEKIRVLEDGSIPEVKMTSQGVGEPFGPGETIYGYQACQLTGQCFIDVDEEYGEVLRSITPGDTAVFRYIRSNSPWSGCCIKARGKGKIRIFIRAEFAGEVIVNGSDEVSVPIQASGEEAELKLVFEEASELELLSVTLF